MKLMKINRFTPKKALMVVFSVSTLLFALLFVYTSLFAELATPSYTRADVAADTQLVLISPPSVNGLSVGSEISVGFRLVTNDQITASELVINFEPSALEGLGIDEQADVLALGKTINNTIGRIAVDIVKSGPGYFPLNSNLVVLRFRYKGQATSASINVSSETKIGIPNQIGVLGSLNLVFSGGTATSTYCGDGIVQSPNTAGVYEVCDDGNNLDGDRCSADCLNSCPINQVWKEGRCQDIATTADPSNNQNSSGTTTPPSTIVDKDQSQTITNETKQTDTFPTSPSSGATTTLPKTTTGANNSAISDSKDKLESARIQTGEIKSDNVNIAVVRTLLVISLTASISSGGILAWLLLKKPAITNIPLS